jgi:hypothetical protein
LKTPRKSRLLKRKAPTTLLRLFLAPKCPC